MEEQQILNLTNDSLIQTAKKVYYVYIIQNKLSGKIYVGWTDNPIKRWKKHKVAANCKREREKYYIHRAMVKHGIENFEFSVIEIHPTQEEAKEAEIFFIAYFKSLGAQLYNLTDGGEGCCGRVVSEETRMKISQSNMGKKHTEETKQKIRKSSLGKKRLPEIVEKTASKLRGRKMTEEQKEAYKGSKSEEAKINMSIAQKKKYDEDPIYRQMILDRLAGWNEIVRKGEEVGTSKLTDKQVIEIRELYATGKYTHKQLGKIYNISKTIVGYIIRNKIWTHLPLYTGSYSRIGPSKLNMESVRIIRQKFANNFTIKQLAEEFSVSVYTISNIVYNVSWIEKENNE